VALAIRISQKIRAMQSSCARGAVRVGETDLGTAKVDHVLPALRLRDLADKKRRMERVKIWSRIHMSCSRLTTATGHRTTAILLETGGAAAIDIPSRQVLVSIPVQINVVIRAGRGEIAAMTVAREMTKTAALCSRTP